LLHAPAVKRTATGGSVPRGAALMRCAAVSRHGYIDDTSLRLDPAVPNGQITAADTAAPERTRQSGPPTRFGLGLDREDPRQSCLPSLRPVAVRSPTLAGRLTHACGQPRARGGARSREVGDSFATRPLDGGEPVLDLSPQLDRSRPSMNLSGADKPTRRVPRRPHTSSAMLVISAEITSTSIAVRGKCTNRSIATITRIAPHVATAM
jgi:hypothetical protein